MSITSEPTVWEPILAKIDEIYKESSTPKVQSDAGHSLQLDAILYINLNSRPDRLKHLEEHVLRKIGHLAKHIERIEAVAKPQNGGKGCALSHLKAFDRILQHNWDHENNPWNTILIIEDDATLDMPVPEFEQKMTQIVQEPFDLVVCGSEIYDATTLDCDPTQPFEKLETFAQCTTSYMIRSHYVPVLRALWQHCVDNLSDRLNRSEYRVYAIDQAWKLLFPKHHCLWMCGNAFRQYKSFSDIEKRIVNYNKWHPRRLLTDT